MRNDRRVIMYSTPWCGDCHRAKALLEAFDVPFEEVDIEQRPEAADLVIRHNEGKRRVPTFEIDGSYFGNPPLTRLKEILDLH